MADYNSSLPVRTQTNGDVVAFLADGTTPTQLLAISSAGALSLTSGGSASGGTAAAVSNLAGGIFNSALPTLTNGQQVSLQLDSSGKLIVDGSTVTQPVSGTVAVTQSTSPWVTQDLADGSVSGGTAGTFSQLSGGIYNSTPPTLTTGQQASLQLDSSGNLKVDIATGTLTIGSVDESTFTAGTSVFSPDGGVFNDALTVLTAGQQAESRITGFRALHVNLRNNSGTEIGTSTTPIVNNMAQVGGAAIALGQTTMSASLPVAIASNQSAIPVTQSTSPWITSDLADGSVAAGAAGTKSMLGGLVFNTAAPSLTNSQQVALQGDAAGNLKVNLQTALPAGANTIGIVNQGTPNTVGNAWPIEVTNGTSTAFVTPASTAALATNPALVVALSPNSPVPAGTNAIGSVLANIQVASAPVSVTNPVPVTITSGSAGTPIQQYLTSVALAAGASVTLTYTVPATHSFSLERIWASASGKIKVVGQNGVTNIFAGFNSTANPNVDFTVTAPPTIAAAGTVNVIITNEDKAAFDVYATVEGNQIS